MRSTRLARRSAPRDESCKSPRWQSVWLPRRKFSDEPVADVGSSAWRILFDAARAFAANGGEPPERLPDLTGDLCLLPGAVALTAPTVSRASMTLSGARPRVGRIAPARD